VISVHELCQTDNFEIKLKEKLSVKWKLCFFEKQLKICKFTKQVKLKKNTNNNGNTNDGTFYFIFVSRYIQVPNLANLIEIKFCNLKHLFSLIHVLLWIYFFLFFSLRLFEYNFQSDYTISQKNYDKATVFRPLFDIK
jgi:hypothetical protein